MNFLKDHDVFGLALGLCLSLIALNSTAQPDQNQFTQFKTIPRISIRALEVLNDSTVWFAADRGVWGFTENAGLTWHIDSIHVDTVWPQFRSMAVLNDSTVLLLSIASPAYMMRTTNKGKTWRVVYTDTRPDIFFDSMRFMDKHRGLAVADPINRHLQIIRTENAGQHWAAVETGIVLDSGEAMFASSNSNIDFANGYTWMATGGKRSRVFRMGLDGSVTAIETPLPQGGEMTGIYSIDFWNDSLGAVAGGNYDRTASTIASLAMTENGGQTWQTVDGSKAFFGSCVQFRNQNELWLTGHDGTFRYSISKQLMIEQLGPNKQPIRFHTLRFSPSGKVFWLAGKDGVLGRVDL